ncbi:hypothetical protein KEJ26_00250 [Candidatus Bathyarchaeota archaeon]|nr:hypothetical protein [Candidatus Bathyarchaeota archaeon]
MGENREDEVKRLAEIKASLEKKIRKLEAELENYKALMEIVNSTLAEKSFKKIEAPIKPPKAVPTTIPSPPQPTSPVEYKQTIPLKTSTGTMLANMYVSDDTIRVVPAEGVVLNVNTPPFQAFLINRVLEPMEARDREAAKMGEITPDEILSHKVTQEGDIIRELIIRNYRDERRLREIKTSLRWTLEKMYEKTAKAVP